MLHRLACITNLLADCLNIRPIFASGPHVPLIARVGACMRSQINGRHAMNLLSSVTGEMSDSKVAAVFDSEAEARAIARQVQHMLGAQQGQVQVITPLDTRPGRKMEPEGRGIFRTILVAHYKLGLIGLAMGATLFAVLYMSGLEAVVLSPGLAAALIVGYGGVFGLMAGGLVSLRPDHSPYVAKVRTALKEGRCAVVVHAFDDAQRDRAQEMLAAHGGDTIRTL
ncbi:riboflavin biosynthesis protein RibA [Pseudoxanthomonas daejeonensis]|nr:riboflavin biosynthesis protein RibA [Pseudoxanthomonas daejeonensis]